MATDKIDFEIVGDAGKAIAALSRTAAALTTAVNKIGAMNAEARKAKVATEGAADSMGRWVTSALGIGSAVAALRTLVNLMQESDQLAKEAMARNEGQVSSRKNLAQVMADPQSAALMARAIARPLAEGGDVSFAATSAGFEQDVARKILGPVSLIEDEVEGVIKGLQKIEVNFPTFRGKEREIINAALAGGVEAVPNLADYLTQTARVAAAAAKLGISLEDVFAATALGTQAQEPEMGARAIRAAISSIAEFPEFEHLLGKGLDDVIAGIREMFTDASGVFDERAATSVFKEELAALGARLMIVNPDILKENRAFVARELAATGSGDFLERTGQKAQKIAVLVANRELAQSRLTQELATIDAGVMEQGQQGILAIARGELTRQRAAGEISIITESLGEYFLKKIDKYVTSPTTTALHAANMLDPGPLASKEQQESFKDAMAKLTNAASVFEDAAKLSKVAAAAQSDNARKPVRVGEIE